MHADNTVINEGRYWQTLEAVRKGSPKTDAVTTFALIIESIDLVDVVCFMITSQEKEVVGVFHFVLKKKTNALNALLSPIHVIAIRKNYPEKIPQKQVIGLLRRSSIFK